MDDSLTLNEAVIADAFHPRPLTPAEVQARRSAHKQRCSTLPAPQPGEVERMVADFIAARGVTRCPPAYAAAIQQLPPAPTTPYGGNPLRGGTHTGLQHRRRPIPLAVLAAEGPGYADRIAATAAPVMRRSSPGVVWNTWLGEPAAAQIGSSAIRSSSSSSNGGVMWPTGAPPRIARPVMATTPRAA